MGNYIVHKAVELDALSAKVKATLDARIWVLSPKYDGCRVVFLFSYGHFVGAFSRTGEVVKSMNHIAADLLAAYPSVALGHTAVCGEAWVRGKEFNEISGMFRRQYPQPELGFVPFDCVDWEWAANPGEPACLFSDKPYAQRIAELAGPGYSKVEPTWFYMLQGKFASVLAEATVLAKARKADTTGAYDGCVLADAAGKYTVGAGKGGEFIKVKPLLSYTVTVTGAALDFGAKTGKNTAALKFMLDGLEQKVSTGLTQAQIEEITAVGWDGYRIEVEAMGKTVNGYLREPRFKGIRTDA